MKRMMTLAILSACVLMLRAQYGNPKVDGFLNGLSTFSSADAARAAFNTAKFSEAERHLLQNGLRDPKYFTPIQRLTKTIKRPLRAPQPPAKDLQSLGLVQTQRIAGYNQRLRTEAQSLMAVSSKVSVNLQMIMGTVPKITSLSQTTIEPGQNLIIRGTDFLPQGSVTFTFGSSSFNGTVVYWNTDFILVTFPADIQGIPEADGTVTVKKQNSRLRADAAIRFVPIWQYKTITSNQLNYSDNPYDGVVAFYLWLVKGETDWCSQFDISYAVSTTLYHGYSIYRLNYIDQSQVSYGGDPGNYVGSVNLPIRTTRSICFYIFDEPNLFCVITVKGPLGLDYHR
jgi:hypothetical protein